MVAQVVRWKDVNPDLKILLAVGGWTHGSGPFTTMVATKASRTTFIDDAIIFMRDRGNEKVPNLSSLDRFTVAERNSPGYIKV